MPPTEKCSLPPGPVTTIPGMDPITLTTDRLRLRSPVPGDADAVYAICQDPAIRRWTTVPDPTPGRTPTSS